jgi:hypothetical protein
VIAIVAVGMSEDDGAAEQQVPDQLRARAYRYREMARTQTDQSLADALRSLAEEYEETADQLEPG